MPERDRAVEGHDGLRQIGREIDLDDAEQHARPARRPSRLPSPPMVVAMKAFSTGISPIIGIDRGALGDPENGGDRGQQAREREGGRDHPVGADAHQPRDVEILGGGAHGEPDDGAASGRC